MKLRGNIYLFLHHRSLFAWTASVFTYAVLNEVVRCSTGVFLDQPGDMTITESESATFSCAVANSSFGIFWLVNDTDAEYNIFRQRGITVMPINDTMSHLAIEGYKKNNNTVVHCAAIHYHNYNIIAWIKSQTALLLVLGIT